MSGTGSTARPRGGIRAFFLLLGLGAALGASPPPLEGPSRGPETRLVLGLEGELVRGSLATLTVELALPADGERIRVEWPRGLVAEGPVEARPGAGGLTRFAARVLGPVTPATPVLVTVLGPEGPVDSLALRIFVGLHESGEGNEEDFFVQWSREAGQVGAFPLPPVAGGDPDEILATLPEDPVARAEAEFRAAVLYLAEAKPLAARKLARRCLKAKVLGAEQVRRVRYVAAVAMALAGKPQGAAEVLEGLAREAGATPVGRYGWLAAGLAHRAAGDPARARGAAEAALRLAPRLRAARALLDPAPGG